MQPYNVPGVEFRLLWRDIRVSDFRYSDFLPRTMSMPLYIKDDATAELVTQLARTRGLSRQDAVRQAVQATLQPIAEATPLRERIAAWRKVHPMPPPTAQKADKAFFDDLTGGLS
jgi:antitoxin VapB